MSKYTTQVRYICEANSGIVDIEDKEGFNHIDEVLTGCVSNVFNFTFPIFDENYRIPLEKKILKHYYTREICEETVGLWKLRLCNRLNEIMPYYNQLYTSELLLQGINPLNDVNLTTNRSNTQIGVDTKNVSRDISSTTDNDTTIDTTKVKLNSDTPQGALSESDLFLSTSGATYLTNASKDHSVNDVDGTVGYTENGEETHEGNFRTTDTYLETIVGKTGGVSYATRLQELRKTFLNIDKMIIDDLSGLFFGLW